MNRVGSLFKHLRARSKCGLIAYVTCGDGPTSDIIFALADAGADAIELGVPFSDPVADGPVIQAASQRALGNGTTMADVLAVARQVRAKSDIPLIAFSYLNPVMRYGIERFAEDASAAGIDDVLLTDLPAGRAGEVKPLLHARGLGSVFLLAPTSSAARIAAINRASDHFIYYISLTGVTGARKELDSALLTRLDEVRAHVNKPLAVGFGISRHEHYQALRDHCDAIVVGSAIVHAIGNGDATGAAARAANVVEQIVGSTR
jgi:tryptophan synthase alpha chain